MKHAIHIRCAGPALALMMVISVLLPSATAAEEKKLRDIHVAVFQLDVAGKIDLEPEVLTDQVVTVFSALDGVTLVNHDQIARVAEEQRIALTGLVEASSAVKLGRFISAQYVVVGRASRIGSQYYLLLKIIDVETTVQTTVAVKAPVEKGAETLLNRLEKPLSGHVTKFRQPVVDREARKLAELKKTVKPLTDQVLLIQVDEEHIERPLRDPAAQLAIFQRLRELGFKVIIPKNPVAGWKESLLKTGRYGDDRVDYLIDGEGTSTFAARLQGLTSCRARIELQATSLPGRKVALTTRGVAAGVDLSEALAAKTALEEAGKLAIDEMLTKLAAQAGEKNRNE